MLIPANICILKDAAVRNLRHDRTRILQVPLMQAGFFSMARDALEIHISFFEKPVFAVVGCAIS